MNRTVVILVVVILVIIGIAYFTSSKGTPNTVVNPSTTPTADAQMNESASPSASAGKTAMPAATAVSKPASQQYQADLVKYAGRIFQFNAACQSNPNSVTIKNGQAVMLDNRSGDARTIAVDSVKYYLAGYGWRVITLSKPVASLPHTSLIDCGASQNVAKVNIQK